MAPALESSKHKGGKEPTLRDMARSVVPITPGVLNWAIDEVGLNSHTVASELHEPVDVVSSWRRGELLPNTGQFRALAKLLGRPETFFFLPRPPEHDDVPVAFRSGPPEHPGGLSLDDIASVRTARRVQRVGAWLVERGLREQPELESSRPDDPPEDVAAALRRWLGWRPGTSRQRGTDAQFAKRVRADLEARSLVVMHLSMGRGGWRGFSLRSPAAPLIAANTGYTYRPRVFTYLHELAHLVADTEQICLARTDRGLERWCDRVAGAVLLPADEVREFVHRELNVSSVTQVHGVRRVAAAFVVSLRAAAVRLENLGLGPRGLYGDVDAVAKVSELTRAGSGGGGQTTAQGRIRSLGSGFLGPLLDAEATGLLNRTDTMELLDVTAEQLHELHQLTASTSMAEE